MMRSLCGMRVGAAVMAACCSLAAAFLLESCGRGARSAAVRPTVRLIMDASGINDSTYNKAAWQGVLSFYGDAREDERGRGTLYDAVSCDSAPQYVPALSLLAEGGPDLIVATGFEFTAAVLEAAASFPGQRFMLIDPDDVALPENVMGFSFSTEEGSFLVGALVALQAEADGVVRPQFGFIGGVPSDTIAAFEAGYVQGIRSVLPDAPVREFYAGSWSRPDIAKDCARMWFDGGTYSIYSAAGGTGSGAIAQAVESRKRGMNVWAVGVDTDQFEDGLYAVGRSAVLTSMVKHVEAATQYGLKAVADGTFAGGTLITLGLRDGGVGYTATNQELSGAVARRLEAIRAGVVDGSIPVAGPRTDRAATEAVLASVLR